MLKKVNYFLFLLVGFSLCLVVPNVHNFIVIILLFIWLFDSRDSVRELFKIGYFWVFASVFLLIVIGFIFSSNFDYGLSYLETSAILITLPVVSFGCRNVFGAKEIKNIIMFFISGVITLNLLSLFFISYDLWDPRNLQSNLIGANNLIVRIHPAFLTMYISFCLFFIADKYTPLYKLDRTKLGWVIFSIAVLLVFLVWLNSRAGILSFSLAAIFFIGYKWTGKARAAGLTGLIVFLVLIFLLPFSKHRFLDTPKMVLMGNADGLESDPSVFPLLNRIQVYKCDLELLKWPEILYGYGTGDFRDELQVCFAANGYKRPLAEGMDSHSEYFAQLHRHGIIGLALFLALLIVPFRHALKYKSPLLGAFIILFAITALFENVFSAQKGVTFFALFCPLLWLYAKQQFDIRSKAETSP